MSEHPASCGCPMHGPGPDSCDHCKQRVWRDVNGYWVGEDDTSECPANNNGHMVDGSIR